MLHVELDPAEHMDEQGTVLLDHFSHLRGSEVAYLVGPRRRRDQEQTGKGEDGDESVHGVPSKISGVSVTNGRDGRAQ